MKDKEPGDQHLLEQLGDEERRQELETILLALRTRKLDDYSAGVLNARLIALLQAGRGGNISMNALAKSTNQARRTFYRRVQVARELAPPEMEDLRNEVSAGRLRAAAALEIVEMRKKGHPAPISSLPVIRSMKQRSKMTSEEQALLRGFYAGASWAHQALLQEKANPDWLSSLAHEWRESKRDL
jgi:hypothetical protein